MSLATLGIDAYHLTTLLAHADAGRLRQQVIMACFFRHLPWNRNYVVFCGLRAVLEHAAQIALEEEELAAVLRHPTIGPPLAARPQVLQALRTVRGFLGEIDAMAEGTLAFAAPGWRSDGSPLEIDGRRVSLYTPMLQVRTDLLRAKLLETPWLGRINHQSMVATKAARVVEAAGDKPVMEFGARRTHPAAALDAAWAAHVGGCAATSNLGAYCRFGIPAAGTMDHFLVQAAERAGLSLDESERQAFAGFDAVFPGAGILLVDTYDTERGIRNAVEATGGRLAGVRLDSDVTPASVARARRLLDQLGASAAKIVVSDVLDEHRVQALAELADGFGVGENITCVPDSASGIGAVAKLVVNGYGEITMKLSRGSEKATLPGALQVYRYPDHDLIALVDEDAPEGGEPLLRPVWRGDAAVEPTPSLAAGRARLREQLEALPPSLRAFDPAPQPRTLVASDALAGALERRIRQIRQMGADA